MDFYTLDKAEFNFKKNVIKLNRVCVPADCVNNSLHALMHTTEKTRSCFSVN